MALQMFKEEFTGKYDGMTHPATLPKGGISDGLNMRKVSPLGGWKPRMGCTTFNTTGVDSTNAGQSLHRYENPRSSDYHFITQCNSKLYNSPQDPPTAAAGTAFTDMGVTVGTTPGFGCTVGEYFFYADGSGRPIAWGGNTPYPIAVFSWDDSEKSYVDGTRYVTDKRSDTVAKIVGAAADHLIIITNEIAEAFAIDLGTGVNNNVETLTVSSWQSGAWANRSATDGTLSGGACFAVDGSITWARSASDEQLYVSGMLGYAYKIAWTGVIDTVDIVSITTICDPTPMTNKWDGVFKFVVGALFYDQSVTEYQEAAGKVTNFSTSMTIDMSEATTSDYLFIKTAEPATAFGIGVPVGNTNSADAQIDGLDGWDGDSWASMTADMADTTLDDAADSSLAQTGVVYFDASATKVYRRTMKTDPLPGYWYRLSWDGALSADTEIYFITYASFPDTLTTYDGCVEFKGRLMLWGDPEFPNRLRFSSYRSPFCFSGNDSTYTDVFGDMKPILCAVNFYNELVVFKEDSIWLLEGDAPMTFGILKITDVVGCASPKSCQVAEVGFPTMHSDESLMVVLWQDTDGVYVLDGRKPRKVSMPIDQYFNTEYDLTDGDRGNTCIPATSIRSLQAFNDRKHNEYHLLVPYDTTPTTNYGALELVYNYMTDEWYPPWTRQVGTVTTHYLVTGLGFRGADDRWYTYACNNAGKIFRLEDDTTDKDNSNADVIISHSLKSRAISLSQEMSPTLRFTLRQLYAEFKARAAGTVTVESFKNQADTGTAQATPSAMSMVNTGYKIATPGLDMSETECLDFQIEFSMATADQEMEIYSMMYALEARGLGEK